MLARVCDGALASTSIPRGNGDRQRRFAAAAVAKCSTGRRLARRISAATSENAPVDGSNSSEHQRSSVSFSIYHNVQEGDTLTSIAKHYDTRVGTIALANKIEDIDVLQAGQVLLIPVQPKVFQKAPSQVTALVMALNDGRLQKDKQSESDSAYVKAVEVPSARLPVVKPSAWSLVKYTTPLLLLAPVVVYCVRRVVEAIRDHIQQEVAKSQAERDSWDAQHSPNVRRWQGILDGDRETATPSSADVQPTDETDEERMKREEEELRRSYAELEATYMKFLSDSGLARTGYWRGGVPSSANDFG